MCNDQLMMGPAPKEQGVALAGFRHLGYHLFCRGLVRDCANFMTGTYRVDWGQRARMNADGSTNKLGRDQEAITSMLWHSSHTTWFEFNASSRLVHF
jgi:hypothetical protein